ncbi:MAG TPA: acetoacetate--CoA ligase [Deltaproteobacteria bacterium]|nr:acetoacetate--CoA ligase [Deltaproteobacteria bacterium]
MAELGEVGTLLWTPSPQRASQTQLAAFLVSLRRQTGRALPDYDALYAFSLQEPEAFWGAVWRHCGLVTSVPPERIRGEPSMPGTAWFEGARLNFAENLLRHRGPRVALVAQHESGARLTLSYDALRTAVSQVQAYLIERGVGVGDRVAAILPNRTEAVVAMLATTGLGAIWSSCSPDFGRAGILDRFGQIQPKVLLAADGYTYGGKPFAIADRVLRVSEELPGLAGLVWIESLGGQDPSAPATCDMVRWPEITAPGDPSAEPAEPHFEQLPPDHPVYILYSSGTTGVPKCIVHGAAGTLVQHAKELILHSDVRADDALFYFTTCGWMMWNWLVSGLMTGCRVVLFDGSPGHPDLGVLWRMAEAEGITHFGTSPKYLASLQKHKLHPGEQMDLSALRVLLSTGSPLSAELFRWVYRHVGADLQLASICGGTDIVSCFMLGSPIDPVYAGEIQKRGLGMAVEAWVAPNEPAVGTKGELVCTAPFPSMPVGFYGDPDGSRYRQAYFEHFPGIWRHGDFVEITEHGGVIVYGRSDATLNPGGVRIGTAEIYRVVEALDEIRDSLVVGVPVGGDVRIVLFVVPHEGITLSEALIQRLRAQIRAACTPRHVPWKILEIADVPRTISGKKVELAVARVLMDQPTPNRDAMANPEALDQFVALRPQVYSEP